MAVAFTRESRLNTVPTIASHQARGIKMDLGVVAMDNDYTGNGGDALDMDAYGLSNVIAAFFGVVSGYVFEYDISNEKIIAYYESAAGGSHALKEVVTGADLSAYSQVPALFFGT